MNETKPIVLDEEEISERKEMEKNKVLFEKRQDRFKRNMLWQALTKSYFDLDYSLVTIRFTLPKFLPIKEETKKISFLSLPIFLWKPRETINEKKDRLKLRAEKQQELQEWYKKWNKWAANKNAMLVFKKIVLFSVKSLSLTLAVLKFFFLPIILMFKVLNKESVKSNPNKNTKKIGSYFLKIVTLDTGEITYKNLRFHFTFSNIVIMIFMAILVAWVLITGLVWGVGA